MESFELFCVSLPSPLAFGVDRILGDPGLEAEDRNVLFGDPGLEAEDRKAPLLGDPGLAAECREDEADEAVLVAGGLEKY